MNKSEVFRTIVDAVSEFWDWDDQMVDEFGLPTELALDLSRAIASALEGEL